MVQDNSRFPDQEKIETAFDVGHNFGEKVFEAAIKSWEHMVTTLGLPEEIADAAIRNGFESSVSSFEAYVISRAKNLSMDEQKKIADQFAKTLRESLTQLSLEHGAQLLHVELKRKGKS